MVPNPDKHVALALMEDKLEAIYRSLMERLSHQLEQVVRPIFFFFAKHITHADVHIHEHTFTPINARTHTLLLGAPPMD